MISVKKAVADRWATRNHFPPDVVQEFLKNEKDIEVIENDKQN